MNEPNGETLQPYFLPDEEFLALLAEVDRGPLYATVQPPGEEGRSRFERLSAERAGEACLRCQPAVEPAKAFLFPAKERVAAYPGWACEPETGLTDDAPQILVGLRACDLAAVAILDRVLREGDFEDPFYAERRQRSILISADCLAPAPTCFCNLVGGKPYPEANFDLNLTPVSGGYVVEIGSQAGKEIVLERAHSFKEADAARVRERDQARQASWRKLEEQNAAFKPARPVEKVLADKKNEVAWLEMAASCVECGGCSYVCPTCHCFILYDQIADAREGRNERIKAWDSCLLGSFAKMAGVGGMKATPRPELGGRFENRVRHKFEWFPETQGRLGCVGCGRCAEVCLGGRDIREVVKSIGG